MEISIIPCVDNDAIAERNRRLLDISRDAAAHMGREAVAIQMKGGYTAPSGSWVDIAESVRQAVAARQSLKPEDALPEPPPSQKPFHLNVGVSNETTLEAAQRLAGGGKRVLALNFASAILPGGGFLNGARAQEECLARVSALYVTLKDDPMYDFHRQLDHKMATDWAILSPDVPVFRTDDGLLLEKPWLCSFITCAAPVAKSATRATPDPKQLLAKRIDRVLAIAKAYGYEVLVLGAWGCGVFGGDLIATAAAFREALSGKFRGDFSDVVFAIADWSPERRFLKPFREAFERSTA